MIQSDDGLKMVSVTFKMPSSLYEKVKEYAKDDDREVSSVCRIALARLLDVDKVVTRAKGRPISRGKMVKLIKEVSR